MRYISIVAAYIISVFFQACSGKAPQRKDIVGTWVNPDGATVVLLENEEFSAKSFPAEYVLKFPEPINLEWNILVTGLTRNISSEGELTIVVKIHMRLIIFLNRLPLMYEYTKDVPTPMPFGF